LPFDIGNPPHFSSVSYMRKAVKIVAADKTKSGKPVRKMAFPHKKNRAMSRIFYNLAAVLRIELRARLWYH